VFFGIGALKGGRSHLRLNIASKSIAKKYREGKLKRTLKRELNQFLKLLRGKQLRSVSWKRRKEEIHFFLLCFSNEPPAGQLQT